MIVCRLSVLFLLSVNLFEQASVQAKNVTDILDERNENVLQQALTRHSENIIGLKNESNYEQETKMSDAKRKPSGSEFKKRRLNKQTQLQKQSDALQNFLKRGSFNDPTTDQHLINAQHLDTDFLDMDPPLDSTVSITELECDCGFGSKGCQLGMYGQKVCRCIEGYAQYKDKCEQCNCGFDSDGCTYNDNNGEKTCYCLVGYAQRYGQCIKCDCGDRSTRCIYNREGDKVCGCIADYSQNNDKCERCYCGLNSNWCRFENNKKVCTCSEKYLQDDYGQCVECDCGSNAFNCHINGFRKDCKCRYGYAAVDGKCERCDCGPNSIACKLTFDRDTRCTCEAGYIAERTTWRMNEICKMPESSGWRIATYIESVLFGLIIVVCTLIICCKRAAD